MGILENILLKSFGEVGDAQQIQDLHVLRRICSEQTVVRKKIKTIASLSTELENN